MKMEFKITTDRTKRKYYGDIVWHVEAGVPVGGILTGISENGLVVSMDSGDVKMWKPSSRVFRTKEECEQSLEEKADA